MTTIAYIYKWTHKLSFKWYIGVRTKVGCHPNDGYICSSKIVKPLIKSSPSEWIREILHTGTPKEMIKLETVILSELNAKSDHNSYNLHNGDGNFTTSGMTLPNTWRKKISDGNRNKKRSEASRENYRKANRKKANDPKILEKLRKPKKPGHGEKISAATLGVPKSINHRLSMSKAKKGKKTGPCSEQRKKAISDALKGKHTLPLVICPYCGLEGRSNMKRWHFDNCKKKEK